MIPVNQFQNNIQNGTAENPDYLLNHIDSSKYDIRYLVRLPINEDVREWIAFNIFNFHRQISMLYGTIAENCTAETCPKMTAGKHEFLWSSSKRQPVDLCAAQHIHHLLDWVQEQLDDQTVFPTESKNQFPDDYLDTCKLILKRLFRVYAHVYHHHMEQVRSLREDGHLNSSLKHFTYFVREFNLMSHGDLEPLSGHIQGFT